jgi:heme A synthase
MEAVTVRGRNVLRTLAVLTAIAVYGQIVLGSVVRITGSGLGCPDWPLCYGRVVPKLEYHTLIEYFHRLLGSVGGALVLATFITAWTVSRLAARRRERDPGGDGWVPPRGVVRLAVGLLLLYGLQGVLGGITVLMRNSPFTVAIHLGNAELVLAAAAALALWTLRLGGADDAAAAADDPAAARVTPATTVEPGLVRLLAAAAVGTYLIVVSGAYVVDRGGGGACRSWPLCGAPRSALADVHMLHRVVVGLGGALLLAALAGAWRRWRGGGMGSVVALTAVALLLEVGVGAAQVLLSLPPWLRALHVALASAIWAGVALQLAAALLELRRPPEPASPARAAAWRGAEAGA